MDFAIKKLPPKQYKETKTDEATGTTTEVEVTRPGMTLQLWDIAGHERFGSMTRVYYKNAIAAVVVCDMQRPGTLDGAQKWKEDVDSKVVLLNGNRIPCILLANKVDLVDGEESVRATYDRFVEENGFLAWFATSALSNANVDEAMDRLADAIAAVAAENMPQEDTKPDIIIPTAQQQPQEEKKGCCSR